MPSKAIDDETMDAALLEPSRPVIEYPEYVRADFVRRVYGLVATQLAATGGVAAWLMLDVRARAALPAGAPPAAGAVALALLCGLSCARSRPAVATALFCGFTAAESVAVGGVCAAYAEANLAPLVLCAMATSLALFAGLSLVVLITRRDFGALGGWLAGGLLALISFGLVDLLLGPFGAARLVVSAAGVLLFSGFVLFDTSQLLHSLTPDDALVAAVQLYLDVLNLFLLMLDVLRGGGGS